MNIGKVLVGSDVEFFVKDESNTIVSAEGFVRGTKTEPFKFEPSDPWFATQLDNVLAEGNIPPADNGAAFVNNLTHLRSYLDQTLREHKLSTHAQGVARLADQYLQTENAKRYGCDPSINAWSGETESTTASDPNLRSAGFHIHLGYAKPNVEVNLALGRAMDLFLGVPAVIVDPLASARIAAGYGRAGNIRHQPHGVEYRTLSSFMASTQKLQGWAYRNALYAVAMLEGAWYGDKISDLDPDLLQTCINEGNKAIATALVRKYSIMMPT